MNRNHFKHPLWGARLALLFLSILPLVASCGVRGPPRPKSPAQRQAASASTQQRQEPQAREKDPNVEDRNFGAPNSRASTTSQDSQQNSIDP